ncbi:MAG: DNA-binding protein [Puniceicoccaceae bacterium]|nr:MAG: DNA-binding protein [Puniceicoccaceae bacterium]
MDTFWISQDGRISACRDLDDNRLALTMAFPVRSANEAKRLRTCLAQLQFTERSSLARIGIEIFAPGPVRLDGNALLLEGEAFLYDSGFPCAGFFKPLLAEGTQVGRLFHAPESAKLTSAEIWTALRENRIKLPDTISIDRLGRVFLTPHRVRYTLPRHLTRDDLERVLGGSQPRHYLDKVQVREDLDIVTIAPRSGILTSCSMYLQEHYVLLNRGEGNFGLHSGAVLLDPIKTFGTNVMLEIYNTSDEVVVNPVVSIEVFRVPPGSDPDFGRRRTARRQARGRLNRAYRALGKNPRQAAARIKPKMGISLRDQSARAENPSIVIAAGHHLGEHFSDRQAGALAAHPTVSQALGRAPRDGDTLILDFFPNLFEHIEILSRLGKLKLRRIVFRRAARMQTFFLSGDAHSRLETYEQLGIRVYWHNEPLKDLFVHTYKKSHGFFLREEELNRFHASTILAFYGSGYAMDAGQADAVKDLVRRMTAFFGANVGILTGGGGGVMGLATAAARERNCLTGACFLELESQPPNFHVDFFNSFQETSRHNRQKWFEVADFCIFNLGGVGTLEEIGIELCNLKLGIRPRVPYVFFHDTYWGGLRDQFMRMIDLERAPAWMADYVLFSGDPDEIIEFYRKTLQIL